MTTRIYAVESKDGFHLVEASTKVGALRHVAEQHFQVSVATQRTLVGAMRDGIRIEVAGEQPGAEAS
jgi:hypothetical protein